MWLWNMTNRPNFKSMTWSLPLWLWNDENPFFGLLKKSAPNFLIRLVKHQITIAISRFSPLIKPYFYREFSTGEIMWVFCLLTNTDKLIIILSPTKLPKSHCEHNLRSVGTRAKKQTVYHSDFAVSFYI